MAQIKSWKASHSDDRECMRLLGSGSATRKCGNGCGDDAHTIELVSAGMPIRSYRHHVRALRVGNAATARQRKTVVPNECCAPRSLIDIHYGAFTHYPLRSRRHQFYGVSRDFLDRDGTKTVISVRSDPALQSAMLSRSAFSQGVHRSVDTDHSLISRLH